MVSRLTDNLLGVRDRALLLIGFCGAFRGSELVALDAGDVAITRDGIVVKIRRSKTGQEGEGRKIGIPMDQTRLLAPSEHYRTGFKDCGFTEGPLFRPIDRFGRVAAVRLSAAAVAEIVKRYALPLD